MVGFRYEETVERFGLVSKDFADKVGLLSVQTHALTKGVKFLSSLDRYAVER